MDACTSSTTIDNATWGCFLLQLPPEIPTIPFGFALQTSSNSSSAQRAQQCTDPASHLTLRSVANTRLTWDSAVWCSGGSHVRCSFCISLTEEERWEIERLKKCGCSFDVNKVRILPMASRPVALLEHTGIAAHLYQSLSCESGNDVLRLVTKPKLEQNIMMLQAEHL